MALAAVGNNLHAAAAVRAADAPLADENRKSPALRVQNALPQPLAVRSGIEMAGVHQICPRDRVGRRILKILTPRARADQDNAVRGVRADGLDDAFRVRLDVVLP